MKFYKLAKIQRPGWLGWKESNRRRLFTRLGVAILKSGITKYKPKWKKKKRRILRSICLLAGCLIIFLLIERSSWATADSGIPAPEVVAEREQPETATSTGVLNHLTKTNQIVYGYSSTEDQTDGDPFTTANGETVTDGGIANNCYPYSTTVQIDSKVFRVNDRLNTRYGHWENGQYCLSGNTGIKRCYDDCTQSPGYWDIWFPTYEQADSWGARYKLVKILL